jgi:hypothetical protein
VQVDDGLAVGDGDLVVGDGVAVAAGVGLGDGVAAGGVAGGAPVVSRDVSEQAVQFDGPGEGVQVVREPECAAGFDGSPFAALGDRGRLAGLGDLEAAAGEGVQQWWFAVVAGVLADADGVLVERSSNPAWWCS